MGTSLNYKFNTYKVTEQSAKQLSENTNPFAIVITAAKLKGEGRRIKDPIKRDSFVMKKKLNLITQLKERHLGADKEKRLFWFINNYIHLHLADNIAKFAIEVDKLTGIRNSMGIVETIISEAKLEGKQEGILEGITAVAIEMKKVGMSFDQIANLTKLNFEEIEKLGSPEE